MKKLTRTRLMAELIIACVLAVFVNITGAMLDAAQTEYSAELATKQMEIEGSQEYSVYHDMVQRCEVISGVAKFGLAAYLVGCSIDLIIRQQEK